jgi:hypothetical protein
VHANAFVPERYLLHSSAQSKGWLGKGLPRFCMLDDEYKQELMKAEIKWRNGIIAELESGE